jgi:predicted metal-dependent hydrolase
MIANPEQAGLDFGIHHQYQIRRSKRAKYLRINIHPQHGIEVVLPVQMSERLVGPFVQQHQEWIERQINKLGMHRPTQLPEHIHLMMNNEVWQVSYDTGANKRHRLKQNGHQLVIIGPDKDPRPCREQLQRWLRKKAKHLLPQRLEELSRSTRLDYNSIAIRSQKTRWGSCSSKRNINLNDRLALLPQELVDYVMIHELCHTREMNHSPAFWKLVESHCADYKIQRRKLNKARQQLPDWV